MNLMDEAKMVFDTEIHAIELVRDSLGDNFISIVNAIINCQGKIVLTGMGKPGHIGHKISATMSSLGIHSFFLHPAEALHGDLGVIEDKDIVICISYSGESEEIIKILPNIKAIGAMIIGISGNANSTLIKYSYLSDIFPKFDEACHLGLAPTSSTTVALLYGAALAVVASKMMGFKEEDYGLYHPAGSLGKKLLITVKDAMVKGEDNSIVGQGESLRNAILELGKKGLGIVTIVDSKGRIIGVFTDGDLRKQLEKESDVYGLTIDSIMTSKPIVIGEDKLAIDALVLLNKQKKSCAPVVSADGIPVGTIRLQDIISMGIYL